MPVSWIDEWMDTAGVYGLMQHGTAPNAHASGLIAIAGVVAQALAFDGGSTGMMSNRDLAPLAGLSIAEQDGLAKEAAWILRENWAAVLKLADLLGQKAPLMADDLEITYK